MNAESPHTEGSRRTSDGRFVEPIGSRRLTPLQSWLIALDLLLEDARDELNAEAWRAFIWIACDRVGNEAAQVVVSEALEVTEEAA